jgi:hypothetical protein
MPVGLFYENQRKVKTAACQSSIVLLLKAGRKRRWADKILTNIHDCISAVPEVSAPEMNTESEKTVILGRWWQKRHVPV